MLNVRKKLKDKPNVHLGNEYDIILLWIMWSRNNELFTRWTIILSATRYGAKSGNADSFNEVTYFEHSTYHIILMRNKIHFSDDKVGGEQVYTDKYCRSISEGRSDFIVMAMDNNQRG